MTVDAYLALIVDTVDVKPQRFVRGREVKNGEKSIDLGGRRRIAMRDVRDAVASVAPRPSAVNRRLFSSPEAKAIKKEICSVGRKLWMRQYVDGNGGNISYRIGANEVLCAPTLVSKYDMTPDDIGLTDMKGVHIAGSKPPTSELLLHLEIYKAVPEANGGLGTEDDRSSEPRDHCGGPHQVRTRRDDSRGAADVRTHRRLRRGVESGVRCDAPRPWS